MEPGKYIMQLNTDLYYYERVHRSKPAKIFMTHHLWSALVDAYSVSTQYNMNESVTYNCIPVQVYMSGKFEYYFASHGYTFEYED